MEFAIKHVSIKIVIYSLHMKQTININNFFKSLIVVIIEAYSKIVRNF